MKNRASKHANKRAVSTRTKVENLVVISDTHFGSAVALARRHKLDDGGEYVPSPLQEKLWRLWENFWDWAHNQCAGKDFVVIHVGDVIDGSHHATSALSSANLTVQSELAFNALLPHVSAAAGYFQIRGTSAHSGEAGQQEEALAKWLGAVEDEHGNASRWELWLNFGHQLINFAHHIGSTTSSAYESSALMREIVAAFVESGQWGMRPPTMIVRGHTHRFMRIDPPNCCGIKLPGWQAKTSFAYRIDRMRGPMFGGIVINKSGKTMEKVFTLKQTEGVYL